MVVRAQHVAVVGLLVAVALGWAARDAWPWRRPLAAAPLVVTTPFTEWADTLRRHETLSQLLARAGIRGTDQTALLAATTGLNPRRLRSGIVVHYRSIAGEPSPHRVMLVPSPDRRVWLRRASSGPEWIESIEIVPWSVTRLRLNGRIESSLYEAIDDVVPDTVLPRGERVALAWALADVYDWEVDFTRDVRPDDRFMVLFERLESPEGVARFGRIVAGRVDVRRNPNYAFFFEGDSGEGGFYDEQGRSLRRAFLRAPLHFRRISSRFGGRYHPVLKRWRSHQGIDYAATAGTPVRATASGVVVRAGRWGGYGIMVELRHPSGIHTRYGHLSRLAVRHGARVAQGETIGYVGATGLATGPHLHYEFLVGGRPTNPGRANSGTGEPVPRTERAAFDAMRAHLRAQLEQPSRAVASLVD